MKKCHIHIHFYNFRFIFIWFWSIYLWIDLLTLFQLLILIKNWSTAFSERKGTYKYVLNCNWNSSMSHILSIYMFFFSIKWKSGIANELIIPGCICVKPTTSMALNQYDSDLFDEKENLKNYRRCVGRWWVSCCCHVINRHMSNDALYKTSSWVTPESVDPPDLTLRSEPYPLLGIHVDNGIRTQWLMLHRSGWEALEPRHQAGLFLSIQVTVNLGVMERYKLRLRWTLINPLWPSDALRRRQHVV